METRARILTALRQELMMTYRGLNWGKLRPFGDWSETDINLQECSEVHSLRGNFGWKKLHLRSMPKAHNTTLQNIDPCCNMKQPSIVTRPLFLGLCFKNLIINYPPKRSPFLLPSLQICPFRYICVCYFAHRASSFVLPPW